jgi:AcrR family transcriptional regulator
LKPVAEGSPATPTRGRRSREKTRQKLIDAALRVMSKKGVDGTAIADITEEADVGFGSFYNHFASKGEIAHAVFNAHAHRLKAIVAEIGEREPDRAVAVAYVFLVFLTKAVADPIWGSFVVHSAAELPGMWFEAFEDLGIQHLREGRAAGRFRVSSEKTAMRLIIAALLATMRALIDGSAEGSAREHTVECILRMLGIEGDEPVQLSRHSLPDYISTLFTAEV